MRVIVAVALGDAVLSIHGHNLLVVLSHWRRSSRCRRDLIRWRIDSLTIIWYRHSYNIKETMLLGGIHTQTVSQTDRQTDRLRGRERASERGTLLLWSWSVEEELCVGGVASRQLQLLALTIHYASIHTLLWMCDWGRTSRENSNHFNYCRTHTNINVLHVPQRNTDKSTHNSTNINSQRRMAHTQSIIITLHSTFTFNSYAFVCNEFSYIELVRSRLSYPSHRDWRAIWS